jgi:4-hydroxy-tetrahydrodipicolinate synthase
MSLRAGQLQGVIAALVTPFDAQDRLDETAARRITRHVLEGGVHGILTAGGAGEFPHLTRDERRQITQIAVEETAGRVPVISGTAACSTREAIDLTLDAARAGAAAAVLPPPYYFHLPGRAIFDHFAAVARASPIPIIVCNNPLYTGNPMPPPLISELAQVDRIIGLKQGEHDFGQLVEVIRRVGDRIAVCTGIDSQFYAALCVGARGIFSTAACVIPREMAAIYKAYCDRDQEAAFLAHLKAQPLNQYFEYAAGYVAPCKEALAMLGLEAGRVRKPLPELTSEERTGIRGALKDLGYQVRKT